MFFFFPPTESSRLIIPQVKNLATQASRTHCLVVNTRVPMRSRTRWPGPLRVIVMKLSRRTTRPSLFSKFKGQELLPISPRVSLDAIKESASESITNYLSRSRLSVALRPHEPHERHVVCRQV